MTDLDNFATLKSVPGAVQDLSFPCHTKLRSIRLPTNGCKQALHLQPTTKHGKVLSLQVGFALTTYL